MPAALSVFMPSILIYGLGHLLRAIRLGVLLGAGQARSLLAMYFYTAACSAIIPFKLGELVRINEIAWWSGGYWRGLLIVWIERVFDVIALGTMVVLIIGTGAEEPKDIGLLLWAISSFVFLSVLFFFILPEQLCSLNLHVIRSYRGKKALRILRMIESCYELFDQVRPLLAGKLITLSLLTFFIWVAELLALKALFDSTQSLGAVIRLVRQVAMILGDSDRAWRLEASFEDVKIFSLVGLGVVALVFYIKIRIQTKRGSN
ncbi:hypothetical protein QN360_12395 [Glaciimonas sp. CA11.2]|uniref:lysylphosphatidylglycerol synthase domain-containing protein n=1 Tax=Glaciimonas sp. CA11.2 TaxID=3048601 RepID=UPI002AB4D7EB|nr:lysylphosphatidylglycerol synthase domain-containing protein [Glaciimonas sp. CA11.2]MDY7545040.1 hypothetical protein [Glaciimonas sp. CA11.2]MEB0163700.1 hypothetical protein [Glaciimonas sp. CA11.2]